ncbi:hypothetical protein [Fretibacter rubidus]|uniref:hypothetical protein n=1 Tax=Fretibacter rubidus TaxID=570162 RepID=UPI00352B7807
MTSILKAALTAAVITGFSTSAVAGTLSVPEFAQADMELFEDDLVLPSTTANFDANTPIALVRIDGGRMITTPYQEADDWATLSETLAQPIRHLSPAAYLSAASETPVDGQEADNTLDVIRLAAVDTGYKYVLIYGTGKDAHFASFGGKSLRNTGLVVPVGSQSWQGGDAKALLVETHSGTVIDAVTTWAPDMETLTRDVGEMIERLGAAQSTA